MSDLYDEAFALECWLREQLELQGVDIHLLQVSPLTKPVKGKRFSVYLSCYSDFEDENQKDEGQILADKQHKEWKNERS